MHGDTLTVVAIDTTGTAGAAAILSAASIVYYVANGLLSRHLAVGETALDTFTYTVSDGHGGDDIGDGDAW